MAWYRVLAPIRTIEVCRVLLGRHFVCHSCEKGRSLSTKALRFRCQVGLHRAARTWEALLVVVGFVVSGVGGNSDFSPSPKRRSLLPDQCLLYCCLECYWCTPISLYSKGIPLCVFACGHHEHVPPTTASCLVHLQQIR